MKKILILLISLLTISCLEDEVPYCGYTVIKNDTDHLVEVKGFVKKKRTINLNLAAKTDHIQLVRDNAYGLLGSPVDSVIITFDSKKVIVQTCNNGSELRDCYTSLVRNITTDYKTIGKESGKIYWRKINGCKTSKDKLYYIIEEADYNRAVAISR